MITRFFSKPAAALFKPAAALVTLAAALLVGGCGDRQVGADLHEYLSRLERTLGVAHVDSNRFEIPVPPRAASLQLPVEGSEIDGLDFLLLRGCALQTTVARRNSALGRVAPPSQRLLLELAFLRDAPACIEQLRDGDQAELATTLERARVKKVQQLPSLLFNATLGSDEYRDFWRSTLLPADYPEQTGSYVITALESITEDARRWLAGDYAADETRLERSLAEIARGDGGELLRAASMQAAELHSADGIVEGRLGEGPFCTPQITPSAAPTLRTVVSTFFIGRVQPHAAAISGRRQQIMEPLGELETLLSDALPVDYRQWQSTRDATLNETTEAPARHVRRLQSLLGTCYAEFAPADGPSAAPPNTPRDRIPTS